MSSFDQITLGRQEYTAQRLTENSKIFSTDCLATQRNLYGKHRGRKENIHQNHIFLCIVELRTLRTVLYGHTNIPVSKGRPSINQTTMKKQHNNQPDTHLL